MRRKGFSPAAITGTSIFGITLYCNRFFPICKEKFCSFPHKIEKIFQREEQKPDKLPKFPEQRRKKPPHGAVTQPTADEKPTAAAQPDIPLAYPKAKEKPPVEKADHKEKVTQPPGAEGSPKTVQQAAGCPNGQGDQKVPGGGQGGHRFRPQKERDCRGSS
jgi:hypothetical protein